MRPRANGKDNDNTTSADRLREFRARNQGQQPPTRPTPPTAANLGGTIGCIGAVIIGLLILSSATTLLSTWVDWQWFGSLGYQAVYGTVLTTRGEVLIGTALGAGLFAWINWWVARRITMPARLYIGQQPLVAANVLRAGAILGTILLAIGMGLVASDEWSTILRFIQQVPFGQTDPIFGQDIGFYVFSLPFYEFIRGWAIGLIIVTAIGAAVIYGTRPGLFVTQEQRVNLDPRVIAHLTVLAALFLILIGLGYLLSGYNLLFSEHTQLYGVNYTDEHARLFGYRILLVVALGAAVLLLANLVLRRWVLLVGAFGVWILALVVVGGLYPAYVQNFQVQPSEQNFEQPYIQNHITSTRAAYGLDKFTERPFDAVESPTQADLATNQNTVNNIRLWDYRPLLDVFTQLQAIRSYYVFNGVDIDRYPIGGAERQVMISAREMDVTRLPDQASTWLNQHLVYTHGYGAVVVPVNQIESAGLPQLLLKDLPPQASDPSLALTQPRIYYGEAEENYVFVNTGQPEFDYPLSSEVPLSTTTAPANDTGNATTVYSGTGGIKLGGVLSKLLFAVHFGDGNILLSDYIKDDTRVLIHRDFHEAVQQVAPFLSYDKDPYLVIADGRLYWIQDAFTTTDHYPYSLPYNGDFNYIRNSVKVVIDAYNGSMSFYVFDPTDPIIQTYRRIFPSLFQDKAAMPAALQAHVRYPESMFNVQANLYATFHMTNVSTFYNKEDKWNIPTNAGSDQSLPMEAYFNIMKVPGEDREEFLLMLPFTPNTRQNMIAWMAAKGDDPDYGRVDVIRFPPTKTIYGPEQIGQLINRDPQISSDLSLWNQQGSRVVRGNLLVIPVARSVIYVEPLFIQASSGGGLPGLQRVIAVVGNGVGYDTTLPKAIASAFIKGAGGIGTVLPPPAATPGPGTPTVPTPGIILPGTPFIGTPGACVGDAATLSQSAFDHYQRSQDALKRSDWTTYGQEQTALESDLRCLQQVTK